MGHESQVLMREERSSFPAGTTFRELEGIFFVSTNPHDDVFTECRPLIECQVHRVEFFRCHFACVDLGDSSFAQFLANVFSDLNATRLTCGQVNR